MADKPPSESHGSGMPLAIRVGQVAWLWTKRVAAAAVIFAAAGAVALWMVLRSYEAGLPSTAELKHYQPPQVTRVLARDGTLLAELFVQRRTVVSINQIPDNVKVAVLAAEDADFYEHEGLDYLGMIRALVVNLRSAEARQGGSTITQQVVKNVLLTPDRTFERKAREVLLARRIEQELSKDEILELYLNHIYFGHGRYGVEEASRYYFGKGVADVSLAEAALMAGLPKGPSVYSPRVDHERALRRRNAVLDQIAAKGFASYELVEQAKAEPIVLAPATESMAELAPEAVTEVKRILHELVGDHAERGGYTVTTTIDPDLQASARKAVRANLDGYAERHGLLAPLGELPPPPKKGAKAKPPPVKPAAIKEMPFQGTPSVKGHAIYTAVATGADDRAGLLKVRVGTVDGVVRLPDSARYNPKRLAPSAFAPKGTLLRVSAVSDRGVGSDGLPGEFHLELGPQSALVAIDIATREVRALVGSYESVRGGLDRATRANRQPGSTFKPFVFSYAIHSRRFTPASVVGPISDAPEAKPLLLRDALARSVNESSLWLLKELGAENIVAWSESLGLTSHLAPTESLALGAYEVTPYELATAYTTFAAGGVFEQPTLVTRIVGPDGAELTLPPGPPRHRVLEEPEAFVVTDLLTSVIKNGTGRKASTLKLALAGKTGTSNEAKDAWFAGYSPEMVCVVWTGYDDALSLGKSESGATAALPAWIDFMRDAHDGHEPSAFHRPEGVLEVAIDPRSGLLPYELQEDAVDELFLVGTEPKDLAEQPIEDDPYAQIDAAQIDPKGPAGTPEPNPNPTARVDPPPGVRGVPAVPGEPEPSPPPF